jgi:hypothetical protein
MWAVEQRGQVGALVDFGKLAGAVLLDLRKFLGREDGMLNDEIALAFLFFDAIGGERGFHRDFEELAPCHFHLLSEK